MITYHVPQNRLDLITVISGNVVREQEKSQVIVISFIMMKILIITI